MALPPIYAMCVPVTDAHCVSPPPKPKARRSEPLCTVAQNMCNMVCYLWFGRRQRTPSPYSDSNMQFSPRPEFVSFIADLLATTQVSQSVITLALHYIYTLKRTNPSIRGRRGSEYRLAVTALMLANKFLDDNTYTNKTWSDVSRISLSEINQMEKEFLHGLNHNLYVDLATYESWVLMLTGLIDAKDRETEAYWRRRKQESGRHLPVPVGQQASPYRARSSSPTFSFTFTHPPATQPVPPPVPTPVRPITLPPLDVSPSTLVSSIGKRSAYDAFSPATASASAHPYKRAIPSPESLSPGSECGGYLTSAYRSNGARSDMRYLPYHTLASSPADNRGGVRKAVLRYHELQSPSMRAHAYPVLPPIRLPQSACTSPRDYVYSSQARHFPVPPTMDHTPPRMQHHTPPTMEMSVRTPPSTSPYNMCTVTPPHSAYTHGRHDMAMADLSPQSEPGSELRRHQRSSPMEAYRRYSPYQRTSSLHRTSPRVIAPFANAGPPGVHWSQVPPPMPSIPVYQQPTPTWSPIRGRRA